MADTASTAEGAAASGGMPQFDITTYPNQIFWLIVALVAIYFIMTRLALPRIASVLAERQGTIMNDLAAAEELKNRAAEAEAEYEKKLAEARAAANTIADETRAAIQAELDAELARADEQIAARTAESEKAIAEIRDQALDSVRAVAKDTTGAILGALGLSAEQSGIDKAVDERTKG